MKEHVRLRNYVSYAQECFMNVYGRVKSIASRQLENVCAEMDGSTDAGIDTESDADTGTLHGLRSHCPRLQFANALKPRRNAMSRPRAVAVAVAILFPSTRLLYWLLVRVSAIRCTASACFLFPL